MVIEWLQTNLDNLLPLNDTNSARNNSHTNRSANNTMSTRDGIVENSGENEPHAAPDESTHISNHELDLGAVEHGRIENTLADRAGHFGTD